MAQQSVPDPFAPRLLRQDPPAPFGVGAPGEIGSPKEQ